MQGPQAVPTLHLLALCEGISSSTRLGLLETLVFQMLEQRFPCKPWRAGISIQPVERRSERAAGWVAGCWPRLTHHRGAQSCWMRLKTTASLSKEPSEAADKETWRTGKHLYFSLLCGAYSLDVRMFMEECPSCTSY